MDVVTANQLIAAYPGIERDLAIVYVWAGGKEPIMRRSIEKIEKFALQAKKMLDTFPKAAKDKKQANRIAGVLRRGGKPWPIFVDKRNAIRKGRHRLVVFYVLEYPTIEVVHVEVD